VIHKEIDIKDQEIISLSDMYVEEKQKTEDMYKYLSMLEKPVEEKLERIMNYRKVIQLMNQEHELLEEQLGQIRAEAE
jgi:hypothetical protein